MQEKVQEELTLNETFQKIEDIIAELEADDIDLEKSFEYYDAGMKLLTECNTKIDRVEKQVLEITENGTTRGFE